MHLLRSLDDGAWRLKYESSDRLRGKRYATSGPFAQSFSECAKPNRTTRESKSQEKRKSAIAREEHHLDVDELPDFNLGCAVADVAPDERQPLTIDACPICGSESARPRFVISGLRSRIVDCTACGLGRLYPLPDAETLQQFYPASYYGVTGAKFVPVVEALVRLVGARHVRMLSQGISRDARLLDVGCGRGVLLSSLADCGFEVHGFEVNQAAAAGADSRADIRIGKRLEEVGYPAGHFDEVILWHVLEHLPAPRETLSEIHRILKPGGRLIVAVPNYSSFQARWAGSAWFHLDPPRHLYHFPLNGLRQLLEKTGFQPRSEHHFSLRQNPFGWVQSWLNRWKRFPRNGLYMLLKTKSDSALGYSARDRIVFRLAYLFGMPIACTMSIAEALLKSGATICIVAKAWPDGRRGVSPEVSLTDSQN